MTNLASFGLKTDAAIETKLMDSTHVKIKLAKKITEIIKHQDWNQQYAASQLGLTQSRLSFILRGDVHGVSEAKLMNCLLLLGRDIQIVVGKARKSSNTAKLKVIFQGDALPSELKKTI
jgi:predicted XRE-type DNA-binding protein